MTKAIAPVTSDPSSFLARIAARDVEAFDTTRYPILMPDLADDIMSIMQENLGADGVHLGDLDKITVPAGGGTTFEVPTLEGDTTPAKSLTGIILLMSDARAYWSSSIEAGTAAPDCYSNDGVLGVGTPGGDCRICPLGQWGSDSSGSGKGKACKEKKLLYLLPEQSALPLVVSIPRTSKGIMAKYMARLAGNALPFYGCVTTLALKKVQGNGTPDYSVVVPTFSEALPRNLRASIRLYAEALQGALQSSGIPLANDTPVAEPSTFDTFDPFEEARKAAQQETDD
jgi:hypothetical protein